MSDTWLNGIGLVFNMIGAALIFFFGVPRYPTRERAGTSAILMEQEDPVERKRVERAYRVSQLGVSLLFAGFSVQLAALLTD